MYLLHNTFIAEYDVQRRKIMPEINDYMHVYMYTDCSII